MPRRKNPKIQMNERLNSLLAVGKSRHKAKQKYGQNNVPTIHSISTVENYRQVINQFGDWLRIHEKPIFSSKDLTKISDDVVVKYLKCREEKGLSAYTISRDMAALNKVLNRSLTKEKYDLKKRSYKNIKSLSNANVSEKKLYDYKDHIEFLKATGARRHELLNMRSIDFNYFTVAIIGKGGKRRIATILPEYRKKIQNFLKDLDPKKIIFEKLDKDISAKVYRQEYALKYYNFLENFYRKENIFLGRKLKNGRFENPLLEVSNQLGHNRIDVVIYHYLKD